MRGAGRSSRSSTAGWAQRHCTSAFSAILPQQLIRHSRTRRFFASVWNDTTCPQNRVVTSQDSVLTAQPAVTDALEVTENPVAVLGEHREFGAILERLVERGLVIFADPLAGDGLG